MITCYAEPTKEKSRRLLEAFAEGSGGRVASSTVEQLSPGPAAFYGMRAKFVHLWEQAKREGRDWYWIDNSYFDIAREVHFRITKNAIQHTGIGESDGRRFASLGVAVRPMRSGTKVILAPQSQEFMEIVGEPLWLEITARSLRVRHGGNLIVRMKNETRPLLEDLRDAALLVTWSSAAAVSALLEGVSVACDKSCCASHATDRGKWAAVLADNQWTEQEIRRGMAWESLK